MGWPKRITVWLGSCKDEMREQGEDLGLSEEAIQNFKYCCYEVGIDVDVSEDGEWTIVGLKSE